MRQEDVKLNKIYHISSINNISIGILIPLYIENNKLYTYTIQTVGNSDWLFLKDVWDSKDDWEYIEEFKPGKKTESGERVNKKYIVDRIFTSKIKFD